MTKNPRKSIVASFGLLSAEIDTNSTAEPATRLPSPPSTTGRVGAGVIGAAHKAIDDIRSERDRLKALVESGGGAVMELDPSIVDPSPYPDRLPDDDDESFEAFKSSIDSEGQKVPVQVRKNPASPERYQIVYGHRRWLAAKALGKPVRAIEIELSDLDLVVAQGIENASRQDLTWIERALFASRMDDAGIKPRDIYAALSIEDAELARMRSVYRSIPRDVIELIGRAPKIGRPRWVDLAKSLSDAPTGLAAVRDGLTKPYEGETSNDRFLRVLLTVKPRAAKVDPSTAIATMDGKQLGTYVASAKDVRIVADGALGREFLKFVEAELPDLARRFVDRQDH